MRYNHCLSGMATMQWMQERIYPRCPAPAALDLERSAMLSSSAPNFPQASFVFMEAALRPARSALIIQGDRQ